MSLKSSIEWTESTWNPLTGCTKISPGCKNCYAERMALRLKSMGVENYKNGFKLTEHENSILLPISWKKPQMIFVNSMSDLFHKDVSNDFIFRVFETMNIADWHIFQVLTKRPERLLELDKYLNWSDNIWMGVSVENKDYLGRIRMLKKIHAKVKFISFEPLLGSIQKVSLKNIDWVIAGGESGPKARNVDKKWIRNIRDLCIKYDVPFFFKQWGGFNKKKNGRTLDGRTWEETPPIRLVI
ncbi:MAG: phage Gp37/Gp68 family protein [Melioribacteraceae bacterium]|nr:phage Gp37/Gp68 family protein [Melioribacteraceae bacterium]MCF8353927.1 phage Gp37/Gp68 family protein [Melioribacteraceae bacterium]MCF8392684.1 phage Gp37/Gp68 family protein [Melioribacteraceae bacterium]MCF8417705.1 phage Gp37/Gp68 family protein [Melioribacteraceae bacterium]